MKLSVLKETDKGETRVAIVPKSIAKLKTLGFDVIVETNAGATAAFTDEDYSKAGATIAQNASEAISSADVVV